MRKSLIEALSAGGDLLNHYYARMMGAVQAHLDSR